MIRASRWTVAALTAAFLSWALLLAGARVAEAAPAGANTTEKTTDENTAAAPAKKSEGEAPSLSAAEKEDMKRLEGEAWQLSIDLDMPSLEPQAVQFAILDKDPVPDFIAHVQKMQSFSRRRLEKAASEARKEQLRAVDMTFSWDFGFEKVTGHDLAMLTNTGDPLSKSAAGIMSNGPGGKKWIVTKIVQIKGKPVCWCIPIEVTTGKSAHVTLSKSNTFDLQTVYDNTLRGPAGTGDKEQMKKVETAKELESLLKEKRDTLRKVVNVLTQQYENGSATFESIMLASERLFDAELELAATKAERTAIYEQRVSALRALEKFAEARLNAGFRATEVELLGARAARLEAQIRLLREKEGGK